MKKLLISLLVIFAVCTACIYIFIPRKITVSHLANIKASDRWTFQYLSSFTEWHKWWPANSDESNFTLNNQQFFPDSLFYNAMTINISYEKKLQYSKLYVIPIKNDETQIVWKSDFDCGINPVTRLKTYQAAILLKQNMVTLMKTYNSWMDVTEHVYGFNVIPSKIIDTILIAKMAQFKNNTPSPLQIDSLLKILRNHAEKNYAKQDGYPMMYVVNNTPGVYDVQVALPLDKEVPETKDIKVKWMFTGNVLVARFKGGPYTISKAFEACDNYKIDHLRQPIALPFQSMITDRAKETDTTKWETIVNLPVM